LIEDLESIGDVSEGDIINIGSVKKDDVDTPVEWKVLAVQDGKALLVSKQLLDDRNKESDPDDEVTESDDDMIKWMKEEFLKSLSSEEKAPIISATIVRNVNVDSKGLDQVDPSEGEAIPAIWVKCD
jgi:hypothetical protein